MFGYPRVALSIGVALTLAGGAPAGATRVAPAVRTAGANLNATPFRGAHPSSTWRIEGTRRRLLTFPTPIQHVVVVVMENRTVDNLLSGYFAQPFPSGGTWGQRLNLYDPNSTQQPLIPVPLGTAPPGASFETFDPDHSHGGGSGTFGGSGFEAEASGNWAGENFGCLNKVHRTCRGATPFAYVPTAETQPYHDLISMWASANNVYQPNEGPSFVAHQYLLAAQSGGLPGSTTAPFAEAENPNIPTPTPVASTSASSDADDPLTVDAEQRPATGGCDVPNATVNTLDMKRPYMQNEALNPMPFPCEEYPNTIVDEIAAAQGGNADADWQFIAARENSIWAAPIGVKHLYKAYQLAKKTGTLASAPFAVDPDAVAFVKNLHNSSATRPFASLTFVTACGSETDHPILKGTANGPNWLAWLVNAIGTSQYWNNTAILVTWDDWGGWFDHATLSPWPYHPEPNAYTEAYSQLIGSDANEWGFRVPFIVISPYVTGHAYVSDPTNGVPSRSYSAMMQYAEATFGLGSLGADDYYQNLNSNGKPTDFLHDLFDFTHAPYPYTPVDAHGYVPTGICSRS